MRFQTRTYGGLQCQVFDALPDGVEPELVVVMCHGFGAPGADLVSLGPEIAAMRPELAGSLRFVFPAAPLSLDAFGLYGGRAWWLLDLEARMRMIERGEIRSLRNDVPHGLSEARDSMLDLVRAVASEAGLPASKIVLGGFSQGGMIATDVALHLPEAPAALVILSGTLMNEDGWRELAPRRRSLPVFQSHGRDDAILPFVAAEWLRDLLQGAGLDVEFVPFAGAHAIPRVVLDRLAAFLAQLVTGS
jgi:phospholipase/carboxylesterase